MAASCSRISARLNGTYIGNTRIHEQDPRQRATESRMGSTRGCCLAHRPSTEESLHASRSRRAASTRAISGTRWTRQASERACRSKTCPIDTLKRDHEKLRIAAQLGRRSWASRLGDAAARISISRSSCRRPTAASSLHGGRRPSASTSATRTPSRRIEQRSFYRTHILNEVTGRSAPCLSSDASMDAALVGSHSDHRAGIQLDDERYR